MRDDYSVSRSNRDGEPVIPTLACMVVFFISRDRPGIISENRRSILGHPGSDDDSEAWKDVHHSIYNPKV